MLLKQRNRNQNANWNTTIFNSFVKDLNKTDSERQSLEFGPKKTNFLGIKLLLTSKFWELAKFCQFLHVPIRTTHLL